MNSIVSEVSFQGFIKWVTEARMRRDGFVEWRYGSDGVTEVKWSHYGFWQQLRLVPPKQSRYPEHEGRFV